MSIQDDLLKELQEVELLVDGIGNGIDDLMKRPVAILRTLGFSTVASCEGHESWGRQENGIGYPWIDFDDNIPMMNWNELKTASNEVKSGVSVDAGQNLKQANRLSDLVAKYGNIALVVKINREWRGAYELEVRRLPLLEAQKLITDFTEWLLTQ